MPNHKNRFRRKTRQAPIANVASRLNPLRTADGVWENIFGVSAGLKDLELVVYWCFPALQEKDISGQAARHGHAKTSCRLVLSSVLQSNVHIVPYRTVPSCACPVLYVRSMLYCVITRHTPRHVLSYHTVPYVQGWYCSQFPCSVICHILQRDYTSDRYVIKEDHLQIYNLHMDDLSKIDH